MSADHLNTILRGCDFAVHHADPRFPTGVVRILGVSSSGVGKVGVAAVRCGGANSRHTISAIRRCNSARFCRMLLTLLRSAPQAGQHSQEELRPRAPRAAPDHEGAQRPQRRQQRRQRRQRRRPHEAAARRPRAAAAAAARRRPGQAAGEAAASTLLADFARARSGVKLLCGGSIRVVPRSCNRIYGGITHIQRLARGRGAHSRRRVGGFVVGGFAGGFAFAAA